VLFDDFGQQIYRNELEHKLTFMDKLSIRIAASRGIKINSLKGDEYKILKDYKKLEERKELLNNVDEFFDSRFIHQGNDSTSIIQYNNQSNLSSVQGQRLTSNLEGDSR